MHVALRKAARYDLFGRSQDSHPQPQTPGGPPGSLKAQRGLESGLSISPDTLDDYVGEMLKLTWSSLQPSLNGVRCAVTCASSMEGTRDTSFPDGRGDACAFHPGSGAIGFSHTYPARSGRAQLTALAG
jgi:hypothetical protein